jgi:hypothetical protein
MAQRELPVRTVFYRGRDYIRKIAAGNPINAVGNAVKHMRRNTYEATVAEVYGTDNGKLYAVIQNDVHGNTHILYQAKLRREELL